MLNTRFCFAFVVAGMVATGCDGGNREDFEASQNISVFSETDVSGTKMGWQPDESCNPNVTDPEAVRRPIAQFGVWHHKGWNLCIIGQVHLDDPMNIEAFGYGYKASEMDGYNVPASFVKYVGVMGSKCVYMRPANPASEGPILQGDGVKGDATTGVTISDGVDTVEWDNPISIYCLLDYPNLM